MSVTCQKLAFTHPIAVLKSGLKNNWMKKLDRVNRPSEQKFLISNLCTFFLGHPVFIIFCEGDECAPKFWHPLQQITMPTMCHPIGKLTTLKMLKFDL